MNLEKTIRSLKERGFAVSYFDSGEEAADYLTGEIRGCTVGFGGCQTAQQLGRAGTALRSDDRDLRPVIPDEPPPCRVCLADDDVLGVF